MYLVCNSAAGVYAPQQIYEGYKDNPAWDWSKISQKDREILEAGPEGPENDYYFEVWAFALDNITVHSPDGVLYHLEHPEDVWLIPEGKTFDDF